MLVSERYLQSTTLHCLRQYLYLHINFFFMKQNMTNYFNSSVMIADYIDVNNSVRYFVEHSEDPAIQRCCKTQYMEVDCKGEHVHCYSICYYIYRMDTQGLVVIQNAPQCCGIPLPTLVLLQEHRGFVLILCIVETMSR